jgi:hypothetical protein
MTKTIAFSRLAAIVRMVIHFFQEFIRMEVNHEMP